MEDKNTKLNEDSIETSDRRTFLKKGAVLSIPLVMTAFSRPVLAERCGLSGLISGNLSGQDEGQCVLGYSPGAWKTPDSGDGIWPSPFVPGALGDLTVNKKIVNSAGTGTPFGDYFTPCPGMYLDNKSKSASMLDVLNMSSVGAGSHFVAALLNAYYFEYYVLSKADVAQLWSEYINEQYATLTQLGYSDFNSFLDSTWT